MNNVRPKPERVPLRAAVLAALVLAAPAGAQTEGSASDASRLIGTYSLAEYAPHGENPAGRITYEAAGRMSAMLLPPGREPITESSTAEEYREAMQGLIAYYGTYEIDEATGRVIHHVEAASNPAWIGEAFERWYRFDGEDLRLSLNPDFDNALLWARLPQEPDDPD